MLELGQVFPLAQLQEVLHLLSLLPLLLQHHLLLAQGGRADSPLRGWVEHIKCYDFSVGLEDWLCECEGLLALFALLLLLDEGQHELKLAELLLSVVVQVPVEWQGLLEVYRPLARAAQVEEGGLLSSSNAEKLPHFPNHLHRFIALLPDVLLLLYKPLIAVVYHH